MGSACLRGIRKIVRWDGWMDGWRTDRLRIFRKEGVGGGGRMEGSVFIFSFDNVSNVIVCNI